MEWLASYYRWQKEPYAAAERERYAPLGALKLFAAMRDKPILEVSRERPFGDRSQNPIRTMRRRLIAACRPPGDFVRRAREPLHRRVDGMWVVPCSSSV